MVMCTPVVGSGRVRSNGAAASSDAGDHERDRRTASGASLAIVIVGVGGVTRARPQSSARGTMVRLMTDV
jgi:hypothetical protein